MFLKCALQLADIDGIYGTLGIHVSDAPSGDDAAAGAAAAGTGAVNPAAPQHRDVQQFYNVMNVIGHGTSGEVRLAHNHLTGEEVAIKVVETRKFALTGGLTPEVCGYCE